MPSRFMSRFSSGAAAVLVLLCLAPFISAQIDSRVCTESRGSEKLPSTPQRFHVAMTTMNKEDKIIGHASLMVDQVMYRAAVSADNMFKQDEAFKLIYDSATDQVLLIDRNADEFQVDNCQMQFSKDSNSKVMGKILFNGVERIVPSGSFLNPPPELKIDKNTPGMINGIQSTPYKTCYYDTDIQATIGVTWWYPDGSTSPIQIESAYKFSSVNNIVTIVYMLGPVRNMSAQYDAMKHPLMAPKGVYCKGMVSSKKPPMQKDRFTYRVEEFVGLSSETPSPIEQPYLMHESYDQRANITMLEGDATLFFNTDKGKYGSGVLAKINDFSRGISYIKNTHYGNCTFDKIPEDSWDTNVTPGGPRLKSPGEFYVPSLNELQYKGSGVYRDTDVDIYIGYQDNYIDIGDGKKYPVTVEYYLQIKTDYDMQGNPRYEAVPRGVYTQVPPPLRIYTMTDVFDYNTGMPRVYDHDVSDCFSTTQEQHFELILSTAEITNEADLKYLKSRLNVFFYSLVGSISKAINISPLRVLAPKLSLFAEPLMLVEITITERANVPGYTPSNPESTLAEVSPKLTEAISKKTLRVEILEGDTVFSIPIDGFEQLDARKTPDEPKSQGMSAGAAAGLSIGMLILGALITVAVIFAVSYFRNTSSVFGFKPFGNSGE